MRQCRRPALAVALLVAAGGAGAQQYPQKPIRMLAISAPGGGTDLLARTYSQGMADALGQTIVIDNKPGGGGIIATETLAKSQPDGYTLLMTNTSHSVLPSLHKKLPYDVLKDFAPVSLVALTHSLLLVHPSMPVKSVKDLIAMAKAKPGQLLYASTGNGGSPHLATEMFKQQANIDITHIPYKGTPPAVTDLIAGQVSMMFANTLSVLPYVNSGRLRALAISSIKRSAAAPSLPTIAESGMPGFDSVTWFGLLAPTGVPREAINRLNPELRRIVQSKALADLLIAQGADPIGSSAEEFAARIKADIAKFTVIIKTAGVRAE